MTEVEVLDAEIVFDYSCAGEDAEELKQIDRDIQGSWFYIAGKIKAAHDILAKHGVGLFGNWLDWHGWKRDKAARVIRRYDFVLNHAEQKEELLSLPVSVLDEAARPSASPAIIDGVTSGKIKTVKDVQAAKGKPAAETIDPISLFNAIRAARIEVRQNFERLAEERKRRNEDSNDTLTAEFAESDDTAEHWSNFFKSEKTRLEELVCSVNHIDVELLQKSLEYVREPMEAAIRLYRKYPSEDEKERLDYVKEWLSAAYRYVTACAGFSELLRDDRLVKLELLLDPFGHDWTGIHQDIFAKVDDEIKTLLLSAEQDGTFDAVKASA